MPLYIMCMRPNSVDIKLFADREKYYERIKGKIGMFLDNRNEEKRRLMIYGDRGVGKSILMRKILKDISEERDILCIEIDGDEARSPEDLLRDICKNLAYRLNELYEQKLDKTIPETISTEIGFLDYISDANSLKESTIKTIVERLEGEAGTNIGLFDFLKFKTKIAASEGTEVKEIQEIEQIIDSKFLIKLLENVVDKIHESMGLDILIYIDNLDQLENKESIDDFVTEIIKLKKAIIVASIRREVADKNIGRDFREVEVIESMTPDELMKVFNQRLDIDCPQKDKLLSTELMDIADALKECDGNPLSFLSWLHYLIVDSELDKSNFLENLKGFTKAHYSTFEESKIREITRYYLKKKCKFISQKDFTEGAHIDDDLFGMLVDFGVIVPDNKHNPRMYKISSDFMFYRLGN